MNTKFKFVQLMAAVAALSALAFIGCQKKDDKKHAPTCPYGQVLSYEQSGWVCRYISFNNNQNQYGYGQQQQVQPQVGGTSVLTPPIQPELCNNPANPTTARRQEMVSWTNIGLWSCVYTDVLRGGSDSPIAPLSQGGETCSMGYGQQYGQQYGMNNMVSCATGFICQPIQNAAQQQRGYQQPYYGGSSQLGACAAGNQPVAPIQQQGYQPGQAGYQNPPVN
ncbi:MAG: hypothetical protein SGI74_01930 [Oligoflexia bacterium]|nr:hypothetical protein [Oligoflexia bacterium]